MKPGRGEGCGHKPQNTGSPGGCEAGRTLPGASGGSEAPPTPGLGPPVSGSERTALCCFKPPVCGRFLRQPQGLVLSPPAWKPPPPGRPPLSLRPHVLTGCCGGGSGGRLTDRDVRGGKPFHPERLTLPEGAPGPHPLVPARAAASHPRSALTTRARGLSRSPRSTTPMASPFSRCTLMVLVASHVQNSVRLYTSMLRSCGCLSGLWCGLGEVRTDGCKTGGSEHRLKGAAGRARPQRPRAAEGRGSNLRARLPPHARWGGPRTPERPRKGPGPSLGFRAHPSGPPPNPAGGLRDRPLSGSSSGSCRCTGTTWQPSSRARAGGPFSGLLLAPCSFHWPHALDHDPQILFVCLI